jgi:hypothetical protein
VRWGKKEEREKREGGKKHRVQLRDRAAEYLHGNGSKNTRHCDHANTKQASYLPRSCVFVPLRFVAWALQFSQCPRGRRRAARAMKKKQRAVDGRFASRWRVVCAWWPALASKQPRAPLLPVGRRLGVWANNQVHAGLER